MASFRLGQGSQIAKHLAKQINEAAMRGLLAATLRIQSVIVNEIIPKEDPPPVDRRLYAAAWMQRPERVENGYVLKNTMPYAPVIEYGARAENIKVGRAMIDALTEWVLRKGLAGRGQTLEARSMAWAIARSMQQKGIFNRETEGLRIAEKASKFAAEFIGEEVAREVKKELG